jgi:hypothetical protein
MQKEQEKTKQKELDAQMKAKQEEELTTRKKNQLEAERQVSR